MKTDVDDIIEKAKDTISEIAEQLTDVVTGEIDGLDVYSAEYQDRLNDVLIHLIEARRRL